MTNKDYYKKMGVSFADALKEYDDKKYSTVDVWLNSERIFKHKFKCGDIVFSENGIGSFWLQKYIMIVLMIGMKVSVFKGLEMVK